MEAVLRKLQDRLQQNFNLKRVGGGSRFFGGQRRGEGQELAQDLNSNDKERQKNAVKRVIANMTLGRDVSQLFVDVVKLGQTLNIELKKLVYLYVLNTAKLQPDKALMAVNTFLLDATHQSPIIRALAVRTMMCIRVDCVTEYTLEPLRRAVGDADPYVRKTAAIAIGKLFHQSPRLFHEQGFASELIRLLSDHFPIVSSNAAVVLGEVNAFGTCPQAVRQEWANALLNALPEASEWGQGYILELLASFRPAGAEAAETLVQRVVARLAHTNPAVVMGAVKVVACQAPRCAPEAVAALVPRINSALLTLLKGEPEAQYVVCRNVHLLLHVFPALLRENVDAFYVRFTDPPYVKLEKLRLLLQLVTPQTAAAVVKEMAVYSAEVDVAFVKEVVAAVAALAIKIDAVAPQCANLLLELVGRRPEVLPQVVTAAKNVVRKHADLLLLDVLIRDHGADAVVEEEAKVSLVWMLGEFCDFVEGGAAILSAMLESLLVQEPSVQLALLSAVVKVFLRNPAAMEATLTSVLETLSTRSRDPDLRDRAVAYWRLLSKGVGVEKMKQIVHGQKPPVDVGRTISDAMTDADVRESINTAAAVFARPFRSFLPSYGAAAVDGVPGDSDDELDEEGAAGAAGDTGSDVGTPATAAPTAAVAATAPVVAQAKRHADPLDDLFGGGGGGGGSSAVRGAAPPLPLQAGSPLVPAPAAPPQQSRAPATGGLDDLFAPAPARPVSAAPPVPHAASAVPPLPIVFEGSGIEIRGRVVAADAPRLELAVTNRGAGAALGDFAMQVNTSSFGFVPTVAITEVLSAPVAAPGATVTATVPLRVSDSHFNATRHVVEVGVRSSAGLHRFTIDVAPTELLLPEEAPQRAAFVTQWRALDESCEARVLLPAAAADAAATMSADAVQAALVAHKLAVTARKEQEDRVTFYGACRVHLGLRCLFEVAVVRAPRQGESYVCCKSQRVNDVIPVVSHVLAVAFPFRPVSSAQLTAAKPPANDMDSFFS